MGVLNKLTAIGVEKQKRPGKYPDGGGLKFQVVDGKRGVGKSWLFGYSHCGRAREMGLGTYPAVTLAEARRLRAKWRAVLDQGLDPITERDKARAPAVPVMTFGDCIKEYLTAHESEWSVAHRQQWHMTLATYAKALWSLPADDVTIEPVLAVLAPIWNEKRETALRLRARIEAILDLATVKGHRHGENPARWRGNLKHLLSAGGKVTKHYPALDHRKLPAFMEELRRVEGVVARALEFTILTASRGGEATGAAWQEFDFEARVWVIPASRMKSGRAHRVPLSDAALAVVEALPRSPNTSRVFPCTRPAMRLLLRRMGHSATTHGFRSAFRDWAGDTTLFQREVVEAALAHVVGDQAEQAYRRGDALEKRRVLMEAWAAYCDRPSNVVDLDFARKA